MGPGCCGDHPRKVMEGKRQQEAFEKKETTFKNRITENFNPIGRITRKKKHAFSQTKYFFCF
jgi:hypothetical protein